MIRSALWESPVTVGAPPAEVDVDERMVRSLLDDQHPDLAALAIARVDAGWDNFMFRLGDTCAVRLPRRAAAAQLLINEQVWLPVVAQSMPLPVPLPLRHGSPGRGYPWRWSVTPWLDGAPAYLSPPNARQADTMGAFLQALHQPAPDDAPVNTVRGVPLRDRAAVVEARLARLRTITPNVTPSVEAAWRHGLVAPPAERALWLHGDLHGGNVLVRDGALSGVIDWGDITSGDPATDLACVWMLFEERTARERALRCYGASDAERARAMGWAVLFGAVLLETGLIDNPAHAAMGEATLARVAADG